jgi:hypothetical protein
VPRSLRVGSSLLRDAPRSAVPGAARCSLPQLPVLAGDFLRAGQPLPGSLGVGGHPGSRRPRVLRAMTCYSAISDTTLGQPRLRRQAPDRNPCGPSAPARAGGFHEFLQGGAAAWAEEHLWRRVRPPDGGRWWQMLGFWRKIRPQEGAGDCRADHPQKRVGGGPRG